jgi:hypothetical protein
MNDYIKVYHSKETEVTEDYTTWKYYKNLMGEYHEIDEYVYIKTIEDKQLVVFDNNFRVNYPISFNELLKIDEYYNDLLENNLSMEYFIKGVLLSVSENYTIEELYNLDDGSIIGYSGSLLEPQEDNLVSELNVFTINTFKRWYDIKLSDIDNLYLTGFLANLYIQMIAKLINIRLNNIHTNRTHSYHHNMFMLSWLDTTTEFMGRKTILWLYNNAKYIKKDIGKNNILDVLIKNIFTVNKIGVSNIEVYSELPDLKAKQNIFDFQEHDSDLIFKPALLNDFYMIEKSDIFNIEQFLQLVATEQFLGTDILYNQILNSELEITEKFKFTKHRYQPTKYLFVKANIDFYVIGKITLKHILDVWLFAILKNDIKIRNSFTDENNKKNYNLNETQAFMIVLKAILKLNNYPSNAIIKNYFITNAIDVYKAEDLLYDLHTKVVNNDLINYINNTIPVKFNISSPAMFNKYVKDINEFKSNLRNISVNTNDFLISNTIQTIYNRIRVRETHTFGSDGVTIDDLFKKHEIDFDDSKEGYNWLVTLRDITLSFTNFDILLDEKYKEIIKYVDIANDLSSYSVNFYNATKTDNVILQRTFSQMSVKSDGVIDIKDVRCRSLEYIYGDVDVIYTEPSIDDIVESDYDVSISTSTSSDSTEIQVVDITDLNDTILIVR